MRLPHFILPLLLFALPDLAAQSLRINEIMADPNPPIGLPPAEYLELWNAGDDSLDVSTLRVASGGGAVDAGAGAVPLPPGDYLVLVPEAFAADFASTGARVHAMRLPGLTNGGDEVTVLLGSDTVAHLRYDAGWYGDAARDDGGYSLEYNGLGDPTCGGNWRASLHPSGGTPGRPNSVAGQPLDTVPPFLTASAIDSGGFRLSFSEPLVGQVFVIVNGTEVETQSIDEQTFAISLPVRKGEAYEIRVFADYADCAGNFPGQDTVITLLYADEPAPGQIVINELLFNPVTGGSDFLELYNNSLTATDLRGITVSNVDGTARSRRLEASYLLRPGEYVVLTPDPARLRTDFPDVRPERVIAFDLPAFPNRSGNVSLAAPSGTLIDSYDYSEEQHAELLSTVEGVSLERIDPGAPSNDLANWASAASEVGFGTPTRRNSQFARAGAAHSGIRLQAVMRVFSPDGDGFEDRYEITYTASPPGSLARLHVFDLNGHPVTSDPAASLLAREGALSWDGHGADGAPVSPGPYVVLVEVVNASGATHREKLIAVVAPSR